MSVDINKAIELILNVTKSKKSEIIPIESAVSRVLAQNIKASISIPPFDNSAMDGFGLCSHDNNNYTIVDKILAGESKNLTLSKGECISIMTGASVPKSVDRVVPIENTTINGNSITVQKEVKVRANIRDMGEDIKKGDLILSANELIDSSHIGVLASQGITHIEVYKRVNVAIFTSGDELKQHFEKIEASQIYNSNTPYLIARSKELGCNSSFIGQSDDTIGSLKNLILSSLDYDIIITSGGISVGETDLTKKAFVECGMQIIFSKVSIKPGKPTTFGKIKDTLVLNLPGNPLASALNFEIFAKPMIAKLSGLNNYYHNYILTDINSDFRKEREIDTVVPGVLHKDGFKVAEKFSPGMVNVLNRCNGFIIIGAKKKKLPRGDRIKFLPIKWNFLTKELVDFIT